MYNYSTKFQNAIFDDSRKFKINMSVTLEDNTSITITEANIWAQSMSVESATSATGQFTVGALVASKLTFSLNNIEGIYSRYDFIDAKIVLSVGLYLPDGTTEATNYGVYTVTESVINNNSITITALDNASKLAHEYGGEISFPTTLSQIVNAACLACGVELDADSVPQFMTSYTVPNEIEAGSITYAGLISCAAQAAGCYARADHNGRIAFNWYNTALLTESLDGGTFKYDGLTYDDKPEADIDGGTFNYDDGEGFDGGTFEDLKEMHIISAITSASVDTDNVAITGVKVTSQPTEGDPEESFVGAEGYVVSIASNVLIQSNQNLVAQQVFNNIGGMIFRPLSITTLPDPSIEAGDVGLVAINSSYYPAFFSTVKFCPDSDCAIACDAQTKNRQSANIQSALSEVLKQSKKWVAYEKSAREIALENMTMLMSNALGYFSTTETTAGGGSITYIHNKPNLSDSDTRWCFTEQGFMVSTDGGQTWRAGFDAQGNAVVNVLSAVGINCDWLNGGVINGQTIRGGVIESNGVNGQKTKIQGGTIETNTAKITGGTIIINTDSASTDIIQLIYNNKQLLLSSAAVQVKEGDEFVTIAKNQIVVNNASSISTISPTAITEGNQSLSSKYTTQSTFNSTMEGVYGTYEALTTAINAKASKSAVSGTFRIYADNAARTLLATITISDGVITSISTNG